MKFTMQRDRTVTSELGHVIEFKKGIPTHVPPAMHKKVLEAGAEPEEGLKDDPRDEKTETPAVEPTDRADRLKQLMDAIEMIATENKRENFGASGAPSIKPLAAILGWNPHAKERDEAWDKFQQLNKDD